MKRTSVTSTQRRAQRGRSTPAPAAKAPLLGVLVVLCALVVSATVACNATRTRRAVRPVVATAAVATTPAKARKARPTPVQKQVAAVVAESTTLPTANGLGAEGWRLGAALAGKGGRK